MDIDDVASDEPGGSRTTTDDRPLPPEDLGGETACWAHLVDELDGTAGG